MLRPACIRLHIAPGRNTPLASDSWKVKLCGTLSSCFHLFSQPILVVTANQPKLPVFFSEQPSTLMALDGFACAQVPDESKHRVSAGKRP